MITGGGGGGGGGIVPLISIVERLVIVVVSRVVILMSVWTTLVVPVAVYLASAVEINVLPGVGFSFVKLEVSLKSLLPDLILT